MLYVFTHDGFIQEQDVTGGRVDSPSGYQRKSPKKSGFILCGIKFSQYLEDDHKYISDNSVFLPVL